MKSTFDDIIKSIDEKRIKQLYNIKDDNSPILNIKKNALELLKKKKLPNKKNEEYKYTFLKRYFDNVANEKGYSFLDNLIANEANKTPDFFDDNLDYTIKKPIEINFVDGVPYYNNSKKYEGLAIKKIKNLPYEKLKNIGKTYQNDDPYYLLNNLLFSDGIYIEIEKNANIKHSLIVTYIHNGDKLAFPRTLINIGKNASLTVIERHLNLSTKTIIQCSVNEAIVEENAQFNTYKLQSGLSNNCIIIDAPRIVQKKNSTLNSYIFSTGGKIIRNNPCIDLQNKSCETSLYGFYFPTGSTQIDNHSTINHNHPNCNSNQLYKGIMQDKGVGVFNGKIYVKPVAQKTNAFQSNKNIVLSKDARIYTKPQLEIFADDVKCSHGCTIGELEDTHLFYLRARGLSKEEARALLIKAYASEIITKFPSQLQVYLDNQLNIKLLTNVKKL